ncbi:MAG: hypothetical protein LAO22_09570 [Acidobacteriia bacterium]|nr:hypothetical protein [Terriglobia bacterium]
MSATQNSALFRKLPSTDEVLRQPEVQALADREGHAAVTESVRAVLTGLRQEIADDRLNEQSLDLALGGLPAAIERQLRHSLSYSLRPLVNATGVILHTNLGRAPLAAATVDHIRETALTYSNLEFDLATGERGKRDVHVNRLFQQLLTDGISTEHVGTAAPGCPAERSSAARAAGRFLKGRASRKPPARSAGRTTQRRHHHQIDRVHGREESAVCRDASRRHPIVNFAVQTARSRV